MSNWDNNNVAHTNLWGFERWRLKNKSVTFAEAGSAWSVDYLTGVNPGDDGGTKSDKVKAHATLLDEVFTDFFHAKYEAGVTPAKAVAKLTSILGDSTKTLKDLGDPISDLYLFQGEVK